MKKNTLLIVSNKAAIIIILLKTRIVYSTKLKVTSNNIKKGTDKVTLYNICRNVIHLTT